MVQAAVDPDRGGRVALKRLRRDGPLDVARLKREFRTLADVVHDNLVRLHELREDDGETILVMDLVQGRPFLEYVWDQPQSPPELQTRPQRPPLTDTHVDRLRTALRGVVSGLSALHAAGLLHRDVKPRNILVTDDGQVRIVDFGLATRPGVVAGLAGTVTYMAPEQVSGAPLGPASDWYAVGCLLFEALTGRTPFEGAPFEVMTRKRSGSAPDPAALEPTAPADLVELCRTLLALHPNDRPTADVIAATLGATLSTTPSPAPLVGRHDELSRLRRQLSGAGLRVVHVSAPSGLGKTRLLEQLLEDHAGDHLVLSTRCYERERTTFKAIDPLANALAEWWPDPGPDGLGEDAVALMRLLPALARFGRPAAPAVDDPALERRRASRALSRLLTDMATTTPLVVWIDDLQWADRDSLRLLAEVLGSPSPPPALVLLSWRADDPEMASLLELLAEVPSERLELAPLSQTDAAALVRSHGVGGDRVDQVISEAGGSPFFLAELARWSTETPQGTPRLERVLHTRVADLRPGPRALLEAVAVAARPLRPEVALDAARRRVPEVDAGDVVTLTVAGLLTTRRGSSLECTHDQIREAAVDALGEAGLAAQHEALAQALGPAGEPGQLAEHWAGAGEPERAVPLALRAATLAEEALAFDRAVTLYRWALSLGAPDDVVIRVSLGRALARAGYGEAADALLHAAGRTDGDARATLEREALNQLLRSGRFEEAFALLPAVLAHVGLPWPRTRLGAVAELVWDTTVVQLGAPRRTPRPADRQALDLALELSLSLSFADMLRAGVLTARAIRLAQRIGEPETLALASALRGSNATLLGDIEGGAHHLRRSTELLPGNAATEVAAMVDLQHGIAAAALCQFDEALERLPRVAAVFEGLGMPYEAGMAQTFLAFSLVQTGQLAEARSLRDRVISAARSRGDKHLEVFFRVSYSLQPELMDDDPAATRANLAEAEGRWGEGVSTAWLYTEIAHVQVDVYEGHTTKARDRARQLVKRAGRSGLLRVTFNALGVWTAWAAAAAPVAATDRAARRELDRAIRTLSTMPTPLAPLVASIWRAARGGPDAVAHVDEARALLADLPNPWLAHMVDAQRAKLLGEDPGPHYDALRSMGIRAPARLAALYTYAPR